MSIDENEIPPAAPKRPKLSAEDTSAIWWLVRWIGLPLLLVIAIFYMEPLFRGDRVEVVPTITRQEVHPYPFPDGTGPSTSLAPPPIIRPQAPPTVEQPLIPETQLSNADIVANPIAQPQPRYPQRALEAEREGVVRLRVVIGPDGNVSDAIVTSAQPSGWFDSAAVSAVKQWRYQPSGRTIETEAEIEFKLK
jgi:TonB family protein